MWTLPLPCMVVIATALAACGPAASSPPRGADAQPTDRVAYEDARPVFEQYCGRCHVRGSKKVKAATLALFDMTSYPFSSRHGDGIARKIREVVGLGAVPARMPMVKPGCVPQDQLALIARWADAFDAAHSR